MLPGFLDANTVVVSLLMFGCLDFDGEDGISWLAVLGEPDCDNGRATALLVLASASLK